MNFMPPKSGHLHKVTGSKIGGFCENTGYYCSYIGGCVDKKVATKFGSNVATYYLCVATKKTAPL